VLCHGSGDLARDGCCFVAGQVCPLRFKIVDGRIYEGPDLIDRGTVDEYIAANVKGKGNQDRVRAQVAGITFVCRAAVEVIAADGRLLSDRPAFETAWNEHPDYVRLVRPHWAAIEARLELEDGSYQCSSWRGTGLPQCCFAEDLVDNETKGAGLSVDARELRRAGGS
jgi:hypothetical protein